MIVAAGRVVGANSATLVPAAATRTARLHFQCFHIFRRDVPADAPVTRA